MAEFTTQKEADGKWTILEGGEVVETGLPSKKAALQAIEDYHTADGSTEPEGEDDEVEEKTESNPEGLGIHKRFSMLLASLRKWGYHHSETTHPSQNANTAAEKFAKPAADGQNKLTPAEKLAPAEPLPADGPNPPATS